MSRAYDDGLVSDAEQQERDDDVTAELEVVARITNATTREPWEVYDVRGNSTGTYYVLNVRSTGGLIVPVTVKHSQRFDSMVCLTCLTADKCAHTKFVRRYVDTHMESKSA